MKRLIFIIFTVLIIFSLTLFQEWLQKQRIQIEKENRKVRDYIRKLNQVKDIDQWIKERVLVQLDSLKTKEEAEQMLIDFIDRHQNSLDFKIVEFIKDNGSYLSVKIEAKVSRDNANSLMELIGLKLDGGLVEYKKVFVDKKYISVNLRLLYPFKKA